MRAAHQLWCWCGAGVGGWCGTPAEGATAAGAWLVEVEGRDETAIAAIWVIDGIDGCRVGFLHQRQRADQFYMRLPVSIYKVTAGHCIHICIGSDIAF